MIIPFEYRFPLDRLITQLKFQHQLSHATLLGKLLLKEILMHYRHESLPTLIIPIPLHFKRLQERGFNQALEIAKPLSKKLNIPLEKWAFIRKKSTQAQSSLEKQARLNNMKDAFDVRHPISATHVAVIDDVMTTGETLKAFGKTLKKSQVEKIDVWCLAQTPHI
jgi:ComF family protein